MAISVKINGKRLKALVTITAGTPIFIASGYEPVKADRLLIQMLPGGTSPGKVYDDVPVDESTGAQPAAADVDTVCGQPVILAAANSDGINPGGTYEDNPAADPYNFIDLRTIAIDGTHSGDTVLVDAHLKI